MTTPDIHALSVLARGSDDLVGRAHEAGILSVSDVQLARTLSRMFGAGQEIFGLTTGLLFAAARAGSSCLELATAEELFIDDLLQSQDLDAEARARATEELRGRLRWPDPDTWASDLADVEAVGDPASPPNSVPVRLVDGVAYLERYWLTEEQIADLLQARQGLAAPIVDERRLGESLARLFPDNDPRQDRQRQAVERAVRSWTTVLVGGPGTGKTTTVARVMSALFDQLGALRVAMAAPSGKAASRMTQSVEAQSEALRGHLPHVPSGVTLHRLLGARGASGEFRAGPLNPLPYDLVVVDEVSMVDLQMFALLLSATAPDTRLLLVGDPHQLQSVNAGTVLADVVGSGLTLGAGDTTPAVTELREGFRNEGNIHHLAQAIRVQDPDQALEVLARGGEVALLDHELSRTTTWQDFPELASLVAAQWRALVTAAEDGDAHAALAELDRHRVLCGHREGLHGVSTWSNHTLAVIRQWRPGFGMGGDFHPGRPVIVTTNDRLLDLSNGDTGVIILQDGAPRLALSDTRLLSPALLRGFESLYAMTVHKGQGSQFEEVTLVLPPLGSPLLTRDLVYTGVTRAKKKVRLIGSAEQVRAAVMTESRRASGLGRRWHRSS